MKKGPFDEAIDTIKVVVDLSAAPDEIVKSCRHAIRVLRAAGKVDRDQLPWTLGFLRDTFAQSIVALLESLPDAGRDDGKNRENPKED